MTAKPVQPRPAFAIAEAFVRETAARGERIDPTDENLSELSGSPVSPRLGNLARRIIHRDWT